jgi:hypothetical protein
VLVAACRAAAVELRVRLAVRVARGAGVPAAAAVGVEAGWPLALAPATAAVVAVVELDVAAPEGSEAFGGGVAFVVVIVAGGVVTSGTDAAGGVETSTFATGGASPPEVDGLVSTLTTPGTSTVGSDRGSIPSVGVSTCTPTTCGASIEIDDEAELVPVLGPESVRLSACAEETPSSAHKTSASAVASAAPKASVGVLRRCFLDSRIVMLDPPPEGGFMLRR